MICVEKLHLVQGQEHFNEKILVLVLERQSEAVDYATQDLEELGYAVVSLGLINEAMERVVDLLAYVGPQAQELAVDSMQDCLQEVTFAWIFAVEQRQ